MRMTSQCQPLMLSKPVANAHRFRRHRLDVRRNVDYCWSYIREHWSRRCKSLDRRRSDEFDHRSRRCVGHGMCWSNAVVHRSRRWVNLGGRRSNLIDKEGQRCEGYIRRWSTVFANNSLLCMKHGAPEQCIRPQEQALRRTRRVLELCLQPQEPALRRSRRALEGQPREQVEHPPPPKEAHRCPHASLG